MYEGRGRGGAAKIRLILLSGQPDTSSFALVLDIIRTIMRIFALWLCLFDLSKHGFGFGSIHCTYLISVNGANIRFHGNFCLILFLRKTGEGQEEHYVFQETSAKLLLSLRSSIRNRIGRTKQRQIYCH